MQRLLTRAKTALVGQPGLISQQWNRIKEDKMRSSSFSHNPPDVKMHLDKNEYEFVFKDPSNLWDQLREMIREQGWTSQDEGTLQLLQEMPNVMAIFAVRKKDNYLLGGLHYINTPEYIYGNIYVTRKEYNGSGLGMVMTAVFLDHYKEIFMSKPALGRGGKAMLHKYMLPPYSARLFHDLWSIKFESTQALTDFFPSPPTHEYQIVRVRNMKESQFRKFLEYDKYITGVDREKFLRGYYGLAFVEGIILQDRNNQIRGAAGIVPSSVSPNIFKIAPIYAESKEDAGTLVLAVSSLIKIPDAQFVTHVRTESAGEWVLEKCEQTKRNKHFVGALCNVMTYNLSFTDRTKRHLIHAPTNSPAHYDG